MYYYKMRPIFGQGLQLPQFDNNTATTKVLAKPQQTLYLESSSSILAWIFPDQPKCRQLSFTLQNTKSSSIIACPMLNAVKLFLH